MAFLLVRCLPPVRMIRAHSNGSDFQIEHALSFNSSRVTLHTDFTVQIRDLNPSDFSEIILHTVLHLSPPRFTCHACNSISRHRELFSFGWKPNVLLSCWSLEYSNQHDFNLQFAISFEPSVYSRMFAVTMTVSSAYYHLIHLSSVSLSCFTCFAVTCFAFVSFAFVSFAFVSFAVVFFGTISFSAICPSARLPSAWLP